MGVLNDSTVRNAAKLAVYEDTRINVKKDQNDAAARVEKPLLKEKINKKRN